MRTAELHTELIRDILNITNIEVLQLIKKIILSSTDNKRYSLTLEEKQILQERENKNTLLYSDSQVFDEIEQLLL